MKLGILLLAFMLSGSAGSTTVSGLRGQVTIGPLTPVCTAETPCYGPAKDVTLTFSRSGYLPRKATTSDTGRYRILLSAGTYAVRANRGRLLDPSRAVVRKGIVRVVDFSIDTGIR